MQPVSAAVLARLRSDRLLLWSTYAAVPLLWLSVALLAPAVLLAIPLAALGLATCFRYGPLERFPPPDDPDY
jgi:hypothetical protein